MAAPGERLSQAARLVGAERGLFAQIWDNMMDVRRGVGVENSHWNIRYVQVKADRAYAEGRSRDANHYENVLADLEGPVSRINSEDERATAATLGEVLSNRNFALGLLEILRPGSSEVFLRPRRRRGE